MEKTNKEAEEPKKSKETKEAKTDVVDSFDEKGEEMNNNKSKLSMLRGPIVLFVALALLGTVTGYIASQTFSGGSGSVNVAPGTKGGGEEAEQGAIFGSEDEETFIDNAEGVLREGGIDGEGAFHLERPGGESQNVYMTSSLIDLSSFIGKKVKVWGETFEGEKAGWLMDVGRLQVL